MLRVWGVFVLHFLASVLLGHGPSALLLFSLLDQDQGSKEGIGFMLDNKGVRAAVALIPKPGKTIHRDFLLG